MGKNIETNYGRSRASYKQGEALLAQQKYPAALEKFQDAYKLVGNVGNNGRYRFQAKILAGVADAYERASEESRRTKLADGKVRIRSKKYADLVTGQRESITVQMLRKQSQELEKAKPTRSQAKKT